VVIPEPLGYTGPAAGMGDGLGREAGGAGCLCSEVWRLEGPTVILRPCCAAELGQQIQA